MLCNEEDCINAASRLGKCWSHYLAARIDSGLRGTGERKRAFRPAKQSAWAVLAEAAINYADADSENHEAYRRAKDRLRWAARNYRDGHAMRTTKGKHRAE